MSDSNVSIARSSAERRALMPAAERARWLDRIGNKGAERFERDWEFWARPGQMPPVGDWRTWLILAGRGFGKTRAGAEWVRALAERGGEVRIALIGATMAEARAVMVEGESGLLGIAGAGQRPLFEPSLKRLSWPGGAQAFLYSAAEPESLRGPQHHFAWADEIAKWPSGEEAWSNMTFGLRLGEAPRAVATTTPRAVALVKALLKEDRVAVSRGRTGDNSLLPKRFIDAVHDLYGGTQLGRQEIDGEMLDDVEGALWTRALIERCRVEACPEVRRVVVGVDPPAGAGPRADACGIVAVALGVDGHAYVVEDATVQGLSPDGWAKAVAAVALRVRADRVVAEANNGGKMVETVLQGANQTLPLTLVHASHGKVARAEPIATLYEAGRAFHVGSYPELEDEMAGLQVAGGYAGPGRSPDRADALVWAMSELMLGIKARPAVRLIGR